MGLIINVAKTKYMLMTRQTPIKNDLVHQYINHTRLGLPTMLYDSLYTTMVYGWGNCLNGNRNYLFFSVMVGPYTFEHAMTKYFGVNINHKNDMHNAVRTNSANHISHRINC